MVWDVRDSGAGGISRGNESLAIDRIGCGWIRDGHGDCLVKGGHEERAGRFAREEIARSIGQLYPE